MGDYSQNSILVTFKQGVTRKAAKKIIQDSGLTIKSEYHLTHGYCLNVPVGQVETIRDLLNARPEVLRAEFNFLVRPS